MKKIILSALLAIFVVAAIAFAEFFPTVIVTGIGGRWVDTRAYSSIATAITAIGANERILIVVGEEAVGTLTIPINVHLKFLSNGSLAVATQLTLQTYDIDAGDHEIFSGAGDIDFASGSVVRSAWFADLDEALDVTSDDTLTMVISRAETLTADAAVGACVTLRWESPFIITDGGFTLSGLKKIEAGTYQIFSGAGDFDFLAGSIVHSSWFVDLRRAIAFSSDENVDLTILVDQPETIDTDTTLDRYQSLEVKKGCLITIETGDTLTINGELRAGPYHIFVGVGTGKVAGSPIVENTISEWWGALGDGITNDQAAVDTALTHWLQRTVKGEFQFLSGKNYLINTAISKTISSNIIGAWSINGYGSKITSGLATGYLFTFTCSTAGTTLRGLHIHGLIIAGSGNEDGILKIDGGITGKWFYRLALRDLNIEGFGGTGIYVTQSVFESSFDSVTCEAAAANTTGYGFHFHNDGGIVSSIDMTNCNTFYGKNGVYVQNTTGDVNIVGGTFNDAQEYGVYLANNFGSAVVNAHFENNWESAANLAAGQAGLYIVNSGSAIGCYGTTDSKQKYVVRLYVTAGKTSSIINGTAGGNTVKYAYIDGAANSSAIIIGDSTYDALASTVCAINRQGLNHRDNTTVSTAGVGEDDLQSYTVAADTMGFVGGFRIIAAGGKTGAGGNKTLKLHWGAVSYTFHAAANNTNDWRLEITIVNYENNAAIQRISWVGYDGATVLQGYEDGAQDTTGAITVKITGECINAGDTISQKIWLVERL